MNIFNRVMMIILMLCLIIFSAVAIVNVFFNLFEWSHVTDRIINSASNLNKFALAAILFLIFAVALIILIFEFYRRRIKMASISTDTSGKTMVTVKTTASQIRESLNNVQGVLDPVVKVVPRQNGIIINIFSKLVKGINITEKTKEIRETASNFAAQNLGFKVLQTNYTATGFVTGKIREVKEATIPEQIQESEGIKKQMPAEEPQPCEESEKVEDQDQRDDIP